MNFKILVLAIIAVMCMIAPVVASDAIWWTNSKGQNITTAEVGDTVYVQFETVNASGGHTHFPPPYDYWGLVMYQENSQSGTFVYDTIRYPGYSARMVDNISGTYINFSAHAGTYATLPLEFQHSAPATGGVISPSPWSSYFWFPSLGYTGENGQICNWLGGNPSEPFGQTYHDWKGYSTFVIPDTTTVSAYKVSLIGYSFPGRWDGAYCDNWTSVSTEYGNATLTVTQHWDIFTGFGDLMNDWGGVGLRYLIGAVIILVLSLVPFLLLHRFNLYLTIIMIACGVGIAFLTGLFDLPVVFALGLGSLAIFFLVNKASAGGG